MEYKPSMNQSISSRATHSVPVVALMTDFGASDGYVGVMKGVIVGITAGVQMIDITHDIAPQNVLAGTWVLATSYAYFPPSTVFVCVVDPGVGSSRGAIAVHAGSWFFVGPDNGLFSYIYLQEPIHAVVALSNPAYQLSHVSSSFHGRDIFAPAGAYLAGGVALTELGRQIDPARLQRIDLGQPISHGTYIDASIVHVDHFGNLITSIPLTMVPELFSRAQQQGHIVFPGNGAIVEARRRFFAEDEGTDDGQPFMYADSSGYVGIAVRNGNAARILGVGFGTSLTFLW